MLSPLLGFISLQSCHIGEEDEGGEQEGEEPSFEVRQTEMVWGTRGRDTGESAEKQLPMQWPHHDITPGTPPHPNISLFISSCPIATSFTPLFNFLLWWTDLCMPLLDSKGGSMLQTVFVLFAKLHDLGAERWCSKRQQNETQVKTYNLVFTSCVISESWFWRRIFRGWLTRICLFVLYFFIC